jgi:hypothetical protein
MPSFIIACIAAIGIAAFAAVVLNHVQEPVSVAFSTVGARL